MKDVTRQLFARIDALDDAHKRRSLRGMVRRSVDDIDPGQLDAVAAFFGLRIVVRFDDFSPGGVHRILVATH